MRGYLLIIVGLVCLLVLVGVLVTVLYLLRRKKRTTPATPAEPVVMPWDRPGEATLAPPAPAEQPGGTPQDVPVTAEAASEDRPAVEPEAPRPAVEPETPRQAAPIVHAPSDDVEQTIRISRSGARPVQDLSAPTPAAPSSPAPPPVVEPAPEPEPVVEPTPALDEHTYWDDEQAEQDLRAESLVTGREIVDGGYGWGSAAPFEDGSMPPGHPVKGHREWMQYHEPGSPWYEETQVDVWFTDAAAAERAGFHRA